jgi:hypothetical protein
LKFIFNAVDGRIWPTTAGSSREATHLASTFIVAVGGRQVGFAGNRSFQGGEVLLFSI